MGPLIQHPTQTHDQREVFHEIWSTRPQNMSDVVGALQRGSENFLIKKDPKANEGKDHRRMHGLPSRCAAAVRLRAPWDLQGSGSQALPIQVHVQLRCWYILCCCDSAEGENFGQCKKEGACLIDGKLMGAKRRTWQRGACSCSRVLRMQDMQAECSKSLSSCPKLREGRRMRQNKHVSEIVRRNRTWQVVFVRLRCSEVIVCCEKRSQDIAMKL